MVRRVARDYGRFQRVVKGLVRKDQLGRYITNQKFVGTDGKEPIVIPVPQIELPHFRHGRNAPDIGQGDGEDGDGVDGDNPGPPGNRPGEHPLEVELTLDDLVDIIGEKLELPRIQPKGERNVYGDRSQYKDIAQKGPAGLRDFRRSYQQALKRSIASGTYDPAKPRPILTPDDLRYRYPRKVPAPESSAVIIFMRDISGSMDELRTRIARTEHFWLEAWLRRQYKRVETRYIAHDTEAYPLDRDEFYQRMSGGGTRVSSVLESCAELIEHEYPPSYWNVYPFYTSDGDNDGSDNERCMQLLEERLLPVSNIFCYTQVTPTGNFLQALRAKYENDERVATHIVDKMDGELVLGAMKAFLGKGR